MSDYRHPAMKQFADQQVRFATQERKLQQLERAEKLLAEIVAARQYPYQYVCYRITDFRPEAHPDLVMEGRDLQHDLRLLIDDVASSAPIPLAEASEPVFTVEDLSKRYSISTKTVNRWRERGLVSRRFLVDGRKRVGFLQSSVDRFVGDHAEDVDRGTRFSQVSDEEREDILRRARVLAEAPTANLAEVSRRIAEAVGRSAETIRYTIRNHDRRNPERAIFPEMRGSFDESMKQSIVKAYRRGIPAEALAARYHRSTNSIFRIINEQRAKGILGRPIAFIGSPVFAEPDADQAILESDEPTPPRRQMQVKPPAGLPPYLQNLYDVPLLTREQEQFLFRRMNYLLFKAEHLRAQIDLHRIRTSDLDQIDQWHEEAEEIKRRLIRANLRLVVSIAKRHVSNNLSLFELVSDGNISLMRAVEKFDYSRGFKFSTYASWAIIKNFARSIPAENTFHDRFVTGQDLAFELTPDQRISEAEVEQSHQRMHTAIEHILARLDDREREIIVDRYGLGEGSEHGREPQTLEQVGAKFGVTKERIRQIEARAIRKLKEFARQENLDLSMLG